METTSKIFPVSDVQAEFYRSTGSYNYANVDDPVDNDADYNYHDQTTAPTDKFTFTDPVVAGRIDSVDFTIRGKSFILPEEVRVCLWISNGTSPVLYDSGLDIVITSDSFADYTYSLTTNPMTGLPWQINEFDGQNTANHLMYIGYSTGSLGFGEGVYISNFYFTIDYMIQRGYLSKWSGILGRWFGGHRSFSSTLTFKKMLMSLSGEIRAMYVMGDYLYVLNGNKFYRVDYAWSKTTIGAIGTGSGNAWIVGDGLHLMVVDGVKGYSWDGTTFAEVTFPDNFSPSSLTFMDGYYIVSKSGTDRFYISTLIDPTLWDALDYATAEGLHDALRVVHAHQGNLWLLGNDTLEIWFHSGASTFPFERYTGGYVFIGCLAARSAVSSDMGVFWLDNKYSVRLGTGIQSTVISTPQIEYQIAELLKSADLTKAVAFYYFQKGHGFYQLTVGNKTFVYDVTTNFWHTRASGLKNDRHPAQCYALYNKKHLVGHYIRGEILAFDYDKHENNNEPFIAIRAAQVIQNDRKRLFHHQLELEFESGVGLTAADDPEAIMVWSDDGGHTWSNEHTATFGGLGSYHKRCVWRKLGNSRNRIYKVTINDPVKRVIVGAHLEAEAGIS